MLKQLIVLAVAIVAASNALSAPLTDADAKQLAKGMAAQLVEARSQLNKLIEAENPAAYAAQVRAPLNAKLRAWPDQNLEGRAIFPYFACKDAALALLQYGDAWARPTNKSLDQTWRDRKIAQFRESQAACSGAIKNPDLSLKDIR